MNQASHNITNPAAVAGTIANQCGNRQSDYGKLQPCFHENAPFTNLGFMTQPELLNVATSRQLMKLVIVGDAKETFSEGCVTSRRIHDFYCITRNYSSNKLNTVE